MLYNEGTLKQTHLMSDNIKDQVKEIIVDQLGVDPES